MKTLCELKENPDIRGIILQNEPLCVHTTFHVGGPADFFIVPADADEFTKLLLLFTEKHIPYFVLGGGSNLVVSDEGIEGAVLSTASLDSAAREEQEPYADGNGITYVRAGCGCSIEKLGEWCAVNGLSGLECFSGLPGTVGGAVFMNARCYDTSFSDVLCSVLCFDPASGLTETVPVREGEWDYKKSPFQDGEKVILSAIFSLVSRDEGEIRRKMAEYVGDRRRKGHFRFPSAGSAFKNNRAFGKPSGQIIDEAGLRGYAVGGAQIAPWHGNFIINKGGASARDIRALVEFVIADVREKTGFTLEPEILFKGRQMPGSSAW